MNLYDICLQYETPQMSIALTNCYKNKKIYNCGYSTEIEQKINKYLELLNLNVKFQKTLIN
jgi:hypothetical protein